MADELADGIEEFNRLLAGAASAAAGALGGRLVFAVEGAVKVFQNAAAAAASFGLPGARALAGLSAGAGVAAAALAGLGAVTSAAIDSIVRLGSAASPGLGKAFSEATEYLIATIGQVAVPLLLPLGAAVIYLADTFQGAARQMADAAASFASKATNVIGIGVNALGTSLADKFPVAAGLLGIGKGVVAPGSDKANFGDALREMFKGAFVHSGQGQPRFEGAAEAYKRIQMAEAGTTDTRRKIMEINRRMLDLIEKHLPGAAKNFEAGDADTIRPATNWG